MKNKIHSALFYLFLLGIVASSCSPKIIPIGFEVPVGSVENSLTSYIDSLNKVFPENYFGKASVTYSDKNNNQSFKASIRMKTDTAMTALLTYAGIPIIQAIATDDSLKFQNKRSKCFIHQDITVLQSNFSLPFTYQDITQILLGLAVHFNRSEGYFVSEEENYSVITSNSRTKEASFPTPQNDWIYHYYVNRQDKVLDKIKMEKISNGIQAEVTFLQRDTSNEYHLPRQINIRVVTDANEINLSLTFNRLEIDQVQEINYVVPDNYEACK